MKRILGIILALTVFMVLFSATAVAEDIGSMMAEYDLTAEDVQFVANIFKQINEGNDPHLDMEGNYYDIELKLAKLGAAMGSGELALWVGEIYQGGNVPEVEQSEAIQTAIEWWEKAVELGQPRGWTNIGLLYAHKSIPGGGENFGDIEQDDEKALEYLTMACDEGDMKAPRYLAQFYEAGRGSEVNYEKALEYYLIAAGYGDITAKTSAGNLYFEGKGTELDYAKALELYTDAGSSEKVVPGVAQARYQLGLMYEQGLGVDADLNKAIEWYQFASEAGYEDADAALARLNG